MFRPGGSTSVSPRPSHRTDRPPHPLRPARAWVGSGQVRAVTDLSDCQTVRAAAPTCWPGPGSTRRGPSPAGRSAPGGAVRRPPASTGSGPPRGRAAVEDVLSWTASPPRYTTPRLWPADGTASNRVMSRKSLFTELQFVTQVHPDHPLPRLVAVDLALDLPLHLQEVPDQALDPPHHPQEVVDPHLLPLEVPDQCLCPSHQPEPPTSSTGNPKPSSGSSPPRWGAPPSR